MMEWGLNEFVLWVTVVIPAAALFILFRRSQVTAGCRRLPPGPPGWPVFGNMFQLGAMPHRTLAGLKQKYGPVVWLKIGAINTMVIQSSKAAAELFKNHDTCFGERTITEAMTAQNFHRCSLSLAPYGTYWRVMKRVMTVEMLVNKRINDTMSVRRKCIDDMVRWIREEANDNNINGSWRGIQVSQFVFLASYNMLGNLMLSRDLVDPRSKEGTEFFSAMISLMEWVGHPNIVDLFPWLRWLDPQGIKRKVDRYMSKTIQIVSKFVKERLEERENHGDGGGQTKKDFLEVLLELIFDASNGKDQFDHQQVKKISEHELNIIIMEVFIAGSETSSGTVEWAMVELLNNPNTMLKVKQELMVVVGGSDRRLEETDIDNLKYLQAVVKETLRLHPPIPLLVPRKATRDTNFMGYDIPKDTQLLVNTWAIGRESECWESPDSFIPERFLTMEGSNIDFKGQHYELLPFGAGRRICAGIPLAHRMLHIVLGTLLHKFDWSVHDSLAYKLKDTSERMGVVVRKIEPLIAIPYPKPLGTS